MRTFPGVCGAALMLCAGVGMALADGAGLAGIGIRGFSEPVLRAGSPAEAPVQLAKKKKSSKKKKKSDDESAGGGGGTIRLDPNTATLKELMVLPLVDERTAQAIIAHRPYASAEDLISVPEVGPCKYRIFKNLVEIKAPPAAAPAAGSKAGAAAMPVAEPRTAAGG